jgi:uncharacterized circularly permuted ATP-grasp superfamily protein/uncharacterized alpha-E superfamily protein
MFDAAAACADESGQPPLVAGYRSGGNSYDEMCAPSGEVRPHWQYVVQALDELGHSELLRRTEEMRRLLRENGVTYNVYTDPPPGQRLWPLDPMPLLVASAEWAAVERGLIQRAELLNLILADLYGPRRLIYRGTLPPELVYGHPGFLRSCADGSMPQPATLSVCAVDLVRVPDGHMRVLGDRTQAPSGAGYALENRNVLSQVLPSLYRDAHVHRLAPFFRSLRSAMTGLDPRRQDDPHMVLLTPGPQNETYFEHAFLAGHLGCTLVEGADLGVRDGRLWYKTLDGLRAVDVVWRRVDDVYCDPLELWPHSLLGAPGLVQMARARAVAVANPLGSGILEHPGLLAFLPALARELLGEDLRLPSVQTWWCGRAEDRTFVLDHLDTLVIKPVVPHDSGAVVFGDRLSAAERVEWTDRIAARPHLFVAQEPASMSTAPVFVDGHLEARPLVVRTFVAIHGDDCVVMPGGLARVAPSPETWIVSNQYGGISKDVWVLASEPERPALALAAEVDTEVTRAGDDVPARVADDLFWLGRYSERIDGCARLLREVLLRIIEPEAVQRRDGLPMLLCAVTVQTATYPGFVGVDDSARLLERLHDPERELLSVLYDRDRVGSVRFNIDALVRAGRAVGDRLSTDASRVINAVDRELRRPRDLGAGAEALQRVIILLAAFTGLCAESMTRGQGWRFLEIGRYLERALHTVVLLRNLLIPSGGEGAALESLLAAAHSLKTYRRRYRSRLGAAGVLDLLVLDESNPRSLGFQLAQLNALVDALETGEATRRGTAQRLSLDALTQLRLFDVTTFAEGNAVAARYGYVPDGWHALDALLQRLAALLRLLSDDLTRRYFAHADLPQQVMPLA